MLITKLLLITIEVPLCNLGNSKVPRVNVISCDTVVTTTDL